MGLFSNKIRRDELRKGITPTLGGLLIHIPNHGDFSAFYTSFSYYLLTFYKQCMVYDYLSSMFVTIHVSFSNLPAKER
jgi:hypothetical protein